MKWFVYCDDENGYEFQDFDSEAKALSFIEKRLSISKSHTLADYRLVKGSEKCLQPVEVVTKVVALDRV